MKISFFKFIVLLILLACLILLCLIANNLGIFTVFKDFSLKPLITQILCNTYFSGISCSIIAVFIIYQWQTWYSKRMLKQDFRCNEVFEDICDGISAYNQLSSTVPCHYKLSDRKDLTDTDFSRLVQADSVLFIDFFKANKAKLYIINECLSGRNTDILLDSIQSCFFINLNFKLLGIVNHIKNRLPNLRDGYQYVEAQFNNYLVNPADDSLMKCSYSISGYLSDVKFMVEYWHDLFDYLGYDTSFNDLFLRTYNSMYPPNNDDIPSLSTLYSRAKKVSRIVRKTLFISRIFFWKK